MNRRRKYDTRIRICCLWQNPGFSLAQLSILLHFLYAMHVECCTHTRCMQASVLSGWKLPSKGEVQLLHIPSSDLSSLPLEQVEAASQSSEVLLTLWSIHKKWYILVQIFLSREERSKGLTTYSWAKQQRKIYLATNEPFPRSNGEKRMKWLTIRRIGGEKVYK